MDSNLGLLCKKRRIAVTLIGFILALPYFSSANSLKRLSTTPTFTAGGVQEPTIQVDPNVLLTTDAYGTHRWNFLDGAYLGRGEPKPNYQSGLEFPELNLRAETVVGASIVFTRYDTGEPVTTLNFTGPFLIETQHIENTSILLVQTANDIIFNFHSTEDSDRNETDKIERTYFAVDLSTFEILWSFTREVGNGNLKITPTPDATSLVVWWTAIRQVGTGIPNSGVYIKEDVQSIWILDTLTGENQGELAREDTSDDNFFGTLVIDENSNQLFAFLENGRLERLDLVSLAIRQTIIQEAELVSPPMVSNGKLHALGRDSSMHVSLMSWALADISATPQLQNRQEQCFLN